MRVMRSASVRREGGVVCPLSSVKLVGTNDSPTCCVNKWKDNEMHFDLEEKR